MESWWELPKMPSLTKMIGKPSLSSLISWLALYLEVLHQIKIHYYSKFHFRVHRYSLNVPAWQHRPSHSCSTHCAWGQAGRGRGVHPLRGEAGEVRHDHAVLWILWRSHEAFRKVFVMIIGRKRNLSTFEVAMDGKAAVWCVGGQNILSSQGLQRNYKV